MIDNGDELYKEYENLFIRYYYNGVATEYFINPCNKGVYSNKSHKMLTPQKDRNGYVYYILYINCESMQIGYHQLVAQTIYPNGRSETKNEIDHLDCDKGNNYYTNLEWVTRQENVRRFFDSGLYKSRKGELNNMALYKDEKIHEIAKHLESGMNINEVSKLCNVPVKFVYKLINKICRKDIMDKYNIDRNVILNRPIRKKASKEEIDKVWRLKSKGCYTMQQISDMTNVPFEKVKLIWYYKNINIEDYR